MEDLTQNFEEFQANMTQITLENKRLANENGKLSVSTPGNESKSIDDALSVSEEIEKNFEQLSALEQAKYVERRLDAVNETLAQASSTHMTPAKLSTPGSEKYRSIPGSGLKSALKRVGNAITGTPEARPFNWIVKQANSEVKVLRERAEKLNWNIRPAMSDEVLDTPSKSVQWNLQDKENETPRKAQLKKNERVLKEALHEYRQQLEEACAVICEQDRLIHAGKSWKFMQVSNIH